MKKENVKPLRRKYLILERLNKLPSEEAKIAKNKLPLAFNISKRTFERWIYLYETDRLEIPADKLAIIAKYFSCSIEELFNYPIPQYNIKHLKAMKNDDLLDDLGFVQ